MALVTMACSHAAIEGLLGRDYEIDNTLRLAIFKLPVKGDIELSISVEKMIYTLHCINRFELTKEFNFVRTLDDDYFAEWIKKPEDWFQENDDVWEILGNLYPILNERIEQSRKRLNYEFEISIGYS